MTDETPRLDLVPALADCKPGYRPVEYNVIVAPGEVANKRGAILMPDEVVDKNKLAQQLGRIVAVSPFAFSYENGWPEGSAPKIGDVVWFARFAGGPVVGLDGKGYRIIKDKDVAAVVEDAVSEAIGAGFEMMRKAMWQNPLHADV